MSYNIKIKDGKWLINGKPYNELQPNEQRFFNEFLITIKLKKLKKNKQ